MDQILSKINLSPAVDRYIYDYPTELRLIMEVLREIVISTVPEETKEEYKFLCPFYSFKGLLCYFNVPKHKLYVEFGLCRGYLIEDIYGVFNNDTKQIRKIRINSVDEIHEEMLKEFIQKAVQVNRNRCLNKSFKNHSGS